MNKKTDQMESYLFRRIPVSCSRVGLDWPDGSDACANVLPIPSPCARTTHTSIFTEYGPSRGRSAQVTDWSSRVVPAVPDSLALLID